MYAAGVGTDPRDGRQVSIAFTFDVHLRSNEPLLTYSIV